MLGPVAKKSTHLFEWLGRGMVFGLCLAMFLVCVIFAIRIMSPDWSWEIQAWGFRIGVMIYGFAGIIIGGIVGLIVGVAISAKE